MKVEKIKSIQKHIKDFKSKYKFNPNINNKRGLKQEIKKEIVEGKKEFSEYLIESISKDMEDNER